MKIPLPIFPARPQGKPLKPFAMHRWVILALVAILGAWLAAEALTSLVMQLQTVLP